MDLLKMNHTNVIKSLFFVAIVALLSSCAAKDDYPGVEYAPQMYHTTPYEPLSQITEKDAGEWLDSNTEDDHGEFYNSNPYNPHNMTMRKPVDGTVRRTKYAPYRLEKDDLEAAAEVENPIKSSEAVLAEGKALYERFCEHCHGTKGAGDGLVGKVFLGVPNYQSDAIKNKSEGHVFHVITHGKGRMGAHASQISVEDRWKIVKYVQKLQQQ
ncbi:MAG: cytochrome c [Cyclobacteriaceae bacterium]